MGSEDTICIRPVPNTIQNTQLRNDVATQFLTPVRLGQSSKLSFPQHDKVSQTDETINQIKQQSVQSQSTPSIVPPNSSALLPKTLKSVTYTSEEMKKALLPSLIKMIEKEPESLPFLTPVDLKLVQYHNVIKNPMDLGQIQKKLLQEEYSDPWEYMEDVYLMLNNARLYNKVISNIYKYTFKVIILC